jgi:hypothetical protein
MMDYTDSIERAAGHYLCDPLPENWMDLAEDKLHAHLENYAWEPFEYYDGDKLWGLIDELAVDFRHIDNIARQKALTGR